MHHPRLLSVLSVIAALATGLSLNAQEKKEAPKKGAGYEWLDLPGTSSADPPKHLVFLTGDEEHRSEESLPMLAKLMAEQHGFRCTVLFCMENGAINPNNPTNMPNFTSVKSADLIVMAWRFREPQDADVDLLLEKLDNGTPMIALRDSIRAFGYDSNPRSKFAKLDWQSTHKDWEGGFGAKYLGSTWHGHVGAPGTVTALICEPSLPDHPSLQGVNPATLATNLAKVKPVPQASILLRGKIAENTGSNGGSQPAMPLAWAMESPLKDGKIRRSITCTVGSARDFQEENLRRFFVNSVYWCLKAAPPTPLPVTINGTYAPSASGFMKFREKQNAATIWNSLQSTTQPPQANGEPTGPREDSGLKK